MALVFAAQKKPRTLDRVSQRRKKIVAGIDQQIALVEQHQQGLSVKNAWFWQTDNGHYLLSIRYGRSEIELAKGMYSVDCADVVALTEALKEVRQMVLKGKLDDGLQKASDSLRAKFKTV
jgi:phosphoenolpyruvate synthase/pyruvate phosphate dikinase